jgi:hypothetical protein
MGDLKKDLDVLERKMRGPLFKSKFTADKFHEIASSVKSDTPVRDVVLELELLLDTPEIKDKKGRFEMLSQMIDCIKDDYSAELCSGNAP